MLATGGIENVRLLLASNDVHRGGIGNHSDWLGRAFAGHSTLSRETTPAFLLMRSREALAAYDNQPRDRAHVVLGASDAVQRRLQGVNFTTTLGRPMPDVPASTRALHTIAARLATSTQHTQLDAFFMLEQTPNRSSRVSLVDERDELGMPRVQVDMRYNDLELDWLERMVAALARELGRLGLGRAQWSPRNATSWCRS